MTRARRDGTRMPRSVFGGPCEKCGKRVKGWAFGYKVLTGYRHFVCPTSKEGK